MASFLLLVSQIYKYAFLVVVAITIFMMVFGESPAAETFGNGIMAVAFPFVWVFDYVMWPMAEWSMSLFSNTSNMNQGNVNAFAYFIMLIGSALIALAATLTIVIYFPVVLLIFPVWTIFDKDMAPIWAIYIDPLHVFGEVTMPLMAEMQNNAEMKSANPVIRQMAINDDLADRIKGKVATKQDVVSMLTSDVSKLRWW